jgi:hypothetical protein
MQQSISQPDNYNIKSNHIKNNNINLKCYKIINIIENIIHKEPIAIDNYTNILVYKKMMINCCKCSNYGEYYLNDNKVYCWEHSQYIL